MTGCMLRHVAVKDARFGAFTFMRASAFYLRGRSQSGHETALMESAHGHVHVARWSHSQTWPRQQRPSPWRQSPSQE